MVWNPYMISVHLFTAMLVNEMGIVYEKIKQTEVHIFSLSIANMIQNKYV